MVDNKLININCECVMNIIIIVLIRKCKENFKNKLNREKFINIGEITDIQNNSQNNQENNTNNVNEELIKINDLSELDIENNTKNQNNNDNNNDNYQIDEENEMIYVNNENNNNNNNNEKCKTQKQPKCNSTQCSKKKLYPILDPQFNMRESAKQCLLLEDHLNNKLKRCDDCIRKHFLIIDGLLEESVSLEKDNKMRDNYRDKHRQWINLQKKYSQNPLNENNLDNISKQIRTFRKPLVEQYFDTVSDYDI
jgi:hypothetical protein